MNAVLLFLLHFAHHAILKSEQASHASYVDLQTIPYFFAPTVTRKIPNALLVLDQSIQDVHYTWGRLLSKCSVITWKKPTPNYAKVETQDDVYLINRNPLNPDDASTPYSKLTGSPAILLAEALTLRYALTETTSVQLFLSLDISRLPYSTK